MDRYRINPVAYHWTPKSSFARLQTSHSSNCLSCKSTSTSSASPRDFYSTTRPRNSPSAYIISIAFAPRPAPPS